MKQFYADEEELKKDNSKERKIIIKNQQKTVKSILKKRRKIYLIIFLIVLLYIIFKLTLGGLHLSLGIIDAATPYNKGRLFKVQINDTIVGSNITNNHSIPIIPTILYLDNHSYGSYYVKNNHFYNIKKINNRYILNIESYSCYYKNNNVETICDLDNTQEINDKMYSKLNNDVKYTKLSIYDYTSNKNIYVGKYTNDLTPYIEDDGNYLIRIIAKYKNVASIIELDLKMQEDKEEGFMNINDNIFTATLEDNNTSKDLLNLLPLNITMNELNSNEKYYYLDKVISKDPHDIKEIKKGDIMLYQDNCLVIFYKDFTTHYPYTRIGHIDNTEDLEKIVGNDIVNVTITK